MTALLAILATLLLLLATLFFVAIGLRVLLVLLVGVVSHFPSPLSRHAIMPRHGINSPFAQMFRLRRRGVATARRVLAGRGNRCGLDRFIR